MLLVKTHLRRSPIHGIGLVASEAIPAGTKIWQLHPNYDLVVKDVSGWPVELRRFTYLNRRTQEYILCCDNAKFFNHSEAPNTYEGWETDPQYGYDFASWNIEAGEELTTDYAGFDAEWREKLAPTEGE